MADKSQGGAAVNADTPGMPYYEKSRQHLKELLQKRKTLERQLVSYEILVEKRGQPMDEISATGVKYWTPEENQY